MKTDSERCVDELLSKIADMEKIMVSSGVDHLDGETLKDAQATLNLTQSFIENNRHLIPSYCQKKANESLGKLESLINRSCKSSILFKFTSKKVEASPSSCRESKTEIAPRDDLPRPRIEVWEKTYGFHERKNETLTLAESDVQFKDVNLTRLENCVITIIGIANTIYIRDLKGCKVNVRLAQRAITVVKCEDCDFKLICQQLRIDLTTRSSFEIYTSARSMLESSQDLKFKKLHIQDTDTRLKELMSLAKFSLQANHWAHIDDFDWLIPGKPSKNYSLVA